MNPIKMLEDQLQKTPDNMQRPPTYSYPTTNLCMVDKDGFFSSILNSLTPSRFHQSSGSLSDLTILCYTSSDEPVPISVQCTVLASQSPLLQDLLLSVTAPVIVLPEVEVEIVRNMLDLLCTGRCTLKEDDVEKVVKLMTRLGLHSVVRSLEQRVGAVPVRLAGSDLMQSSISWMGVNSNNYIEEHDGSTVGHVMQSKTIERRSRSRSLNYNLEVSSSSSEAKKPAKKVFPGRYCLMCGKKERNLYTLRVHYTNNHFFSEVSALITDKKSSKCELCGQQFSDCDNLFCNVVRHRGATHKDVLKFVQKECENDEGVTYDHCEICDVKKDDWKSDSLGQHLIQDHYKLKLEEMLLPGQVDCTICDIKCKTIYDMIAHTGLTHGFAMKMYRDFLASRSVPVTPVKAKRGRKRKQETGPPKVPVKMSKKCHLCHHDIAGAGIYWRFPLYSHFSRIHFSEELIRDFRTLNKECSVCGITEDSVGKKPFLAHLGAKHRLVENYLEKSTILGFEMANDLVMDDILGEDTNPVCNSTVNMENSNSEVMEKVNEAKCLSPDDEDGDNSFQNDLQLFKEKVTKSQHADNDDTLSSVENEDIDSDKSSCPLLKCPHCDKMLQERSLHTHLVSRHFKRDCEEAIKMILQKTDGKCPRCPAQFTFDETLGVVDWSVYRHFARSHKIAEDLDITGDMGECNQDNVQKILAKLL